MIFPAVTRRIQPLLEKPLSPVFFPGGPLIIQRLIHQPKAPLFPPKQKAPYKPGIKPKTSIPENLRQKIIRMLTASNIPLDLQDISRKLDQLLEEKAFSQQHQARFLRLSPREKEVLYKLAQGFTNPEISSQLFIALETVKHHRKMIKSKLEAHSTADFIRYAQAFNLIGLFEKCKPAENRSAINLNG